MPRHSRSACERERRADRDGVANGRAVFSPGTQARAERPYRRSAFTRGSHHARRSCDRWRWRAGRRRGGGSHAGRRLRTDADRRGRNAARSKPSDPRTPPRMRRARRRRIFLSASLPAACCATCIRASTSRAIRRSTRIRYSRSSRQHRRETLLAHPDGARPGVWMFELRLQGERETVFFDG